VFFNVTPYCVIADKRSIYQQGKKEALGCLPMQCSCGKKKLMLLGPRNKSVQCFLIQPTSLPMLNYTACGYESTRCLGVSNIVHSHVNVIVPLPDVFTHQAAYDETSSFVASLPLKRASGSRRTPAPSAPVTDATDFTYELTLCERCVKSNIYSSHTLSIGPLLTAWKILTILPRKCELEYFSQYSVWLGTGQPGFDPRQRQGLFPLFFESVPALGPIQPAVQ
jgi:hypothetical protein